MAASKGKGPHGAQFTRDIAFSLGTTALFYPREVVRILVQVGHEPLPSISGRSYFGFGPRAYFLPNVLAYAGYIRRTEGITGLYRGLGPQLLCAAAQGATATFLCDKIPTSGSTQDTEGGGIQQMGKEIARKVLIKAGTVIVGHPFRVICVRMVSYYVGREAAYATMRGAVCAIYESEGIGGFFSGLMPRLAGEITAVVAFDLLVNVVIKLAESTGGVDDREEMETYARTLVNFVLQIAVYPFQLASTLMIVDGSGMAASAAVPRSDRRGWLSCLGALYSSGEHMRGNSMFDRVDKKRRHIRGTAV